MLGLLGLGLNALPIEILSGVDMLFGSVPVLVAAVLLGPLGGAVAGLVAGPVTLLLWGHPWGWGLLVLVAAGAGLLSRHVLPFTATALTWLLAGPWIYLSMTLLAPHYPAGTATIVVAKGVVEWLVAALLVQVLLVAAGARARLEPWLPPPLRRVRTRAALLSVFALGGVLPLLVMALLGARLLYLGEVNRLDRVITAQAERIAAGLDSALDEILAQLEAGAAAAEALGDDRAALVAHLDGLVQNVDGARAVVVADAGGAVVGHSSGDDRSAARLLALSRTSLPVIPGKGVLTYLAPGTAGDRPAVVLASAPLPKGGRLVAELEPEQLLAPVRRFVPSPLEAAVIDSEGRLLVDSLDAADPGEREALIRAAREVGPGHLATYYLEPQPLRTLQPQATVRLATATVERLGWLVAVEAQQLVLQPEIERGALALLAGIALALLLGGLATFGLTRSVVRPMEAVSAAATLVAEGERGARAGAAAAAGTWEVRQLGERFDHMADALAEQLDEIEHAARVKDEFLGAASHELRTPITTIKAQLQLLQRQLQGTENEARLRVLLRQIERLNRLVMQLLDATRIAAGQIDLELSTVDLRALVARAAEDVVAPSSLHQLQLELEPAQGIWDELRLEQVVQNLVANAVKYSPHGGLVEVAVRRLADGGAEVEVADRGIGIRSEEAEALLERFTRGAAGRRHEIAGLGVGLYVTAEIVRRHGGTISLAPRDGGGAVARVRLPREAHPRQRER